MGKNGKTITVSADKYERDLNDLFGVFFEDISHAADGGLYAELVQNRSFEFDPIDNPEYHSLFAWKKVQRGRSNVEIHVETANPLNRNNSHYLVLEIMRVGEGAGFQNTGYKTGINFSSNEQYTFSCYYRRISNLLSPVIVRLENIDGSVCYGECSFTPSNLSWTEVEMTILCSGNDPCGRLTILSEDKIAIAFDMISLFPVNTFRGRKNGLRLDLANLIADMRPKFIRFPGGCLSHFGSLNPEDRTSIYRWKKTLGNVAERPPRRNPGNYNQTLGLGFYEFFLFCEDIGAKPLPVIAAGYDPHTLRAVPINEIQPWIDEALDLIEFANGDTQTKWGAKRKELGHPAPFDMQYIAIGNEEIGEEFFERFEIIYGSIKAKYPEMIVIGSAGPGAAGGEFIRAWEHAKKISPDYMDEHYYQAPEWFLANMHRYDKYSDSGPKIFLGEYGSCDDTFYNALVEAAFMVCLQNAKSVGLACYAPLLCHVDYMNWTPNLILFNNQKAFGTASYHIQKLFMNHQGNTLLHTEGDGMRLISEDSEPITGCFGFETKLAHVDLFNIILTDLDSGESIKHGDSSLSPDSPVLNIGSCVWKNYSIEFEAKKTDEDSGSDTSGARWFELFYGKNEKGKRTWVIDWWMNLASNRCYTNNRMYELISHRFLPEKDRVYRYKLEINDRNMRTFIDGINIADVDDSPPAIDELYFSSSLEKESGNIIVKVINLQAYDIESEICFEGGLSKNNTAEIYSVSGFQFDDRNSFEEPSKIKPDVKVVNFEGTKLNYLFPKQSVTILRVCSNN